jgi:drug/metabolite transporter (DMT)-like permease
MTLLGLSLVLAAAFCHATWNFCVKRINGGPELIWLFSVVSVILYLPVAVWIVVADGFPFGFWPLVFIAGSALLHLGYFTLLQTGYRHGELSVVYPTARATGPVLSTAFAVVLLGEVVTPQLAVGAATIIFGIAMLGGGFRAGGRGALTSVLFGLGVGGLIGSYTAWDAYAVTALMIPPVLLDYATNLTRVALLAPVARRRWHLVEGHWSAHRLGVIAIAVLSPLAYILVLYAFTFTPVTYVAPLREVSVLLTVLAGTILLKEGRLGERVGWALVVLAGMALLVTA